MNQADQTSICFRVFATKPHISTTSYSILLVCSDRDLTKLPLNERRNLMKSCLKLRSPRIRISEQFETSGTDI
jgi:hypothetical protein